MESKTENINFGEWKVPKNWDEVTLGMFQKIERYYADKEKEFDLREVLDVFTDGHTVNEINQLPIEFTTKLLEELEFIQSPPKYPEPTNKIEVDGITYVVNITEKLKTGEYLAVDQVLKSDQHNYAAMLAILCRKEGEIYDSKFENELLDERIKMWEKTPMMKVMPLVYFFLIRYTTLEMPSRLYSATKEAIDLTRRAIETSLKNGEISRHIMKSAMKNLRKLEKTINGI